MSYTSTPLPAGCLSGQAQGWHYLHVADHCLFGAVRTQTQGMTQKARGPCRSAPGLAVQHSSVMTPLGPAAHLTFASSSVCLSSGVIGETWQFSVLAPASQALHL